MRARRSTIRSGTCRRMSRSFTPRIATTRSGIRIPGSAEEADSARPGRGPCAPERDRGEGERDQRVVSGKRDAEKAPCRLVAARDVDGLQALHEIGCGPKLGRARAFGRAGPQLPLNARMIGAEI